MPPTPERQPPASQPPDAGDWFPWRMFVEAAGAACGFSTLLLAVAGLLAAELGVAALGFVMPEAAGGLALPVTVGDLSLEPAALARGANAGLAGYQGGFIHPLASPNNAPIVGAIALIWRVIVWTFFGAAIARLAAMRLTHHNEITAREALGWSLSTAGARIGLSACLLVAFCLVCAIVALLGEASKLAVIGGVVELLLPLVLLVAAVGAVIGLGGVIGWPLMTAAAAVERPDAFDAMSRGLAYAYQRPLRLLVYVLQAWLVGVLAGVAAQLLVRTTLRVSTLWLGGRAIESDAVSPLAAFWWTEATRLPLVYSAAYYWCAAAAIYLLLRRDIDEQQADEVFLEEPSDATQPAAE